MSLTLNERRKRVDIALQDVFTRINLVNKDLGDNFNEVVKRELLNEPRFTEEGLVEELEAFHDYVLDKLEYHDDERLYTPKTRGRRVADGYDANEDKQADTAVEAPTVETPKTEAVVITTEPSTPNPEAVNPSALPELDGVVDAAPATKAVATVESEDDTTVEPEKETEQTSVAPNITADDILAKEFSEKAKGYSADAVDDVLDDIAEFFRKENPSKSEIRAKAKEIRDVVIVKSRVFQKGPDADEVDDYLDLLIAALEAKL